MVQMVELHSYSGQLLGWCRERRIPRFYFGGPPRASFCVVPPMLVSGEVSSSAAAIPVIDVVIAYRDVPFRDHTDPDGSCRRFYILERGDCLALWASDDFCRFHERLWR